MASHAARTAGPRLVRCPQRGSSARPQHVWFCPRRRDFSGALLFVTEPIRFVLKGPRRNSKKTSVAYG